jgi:hypothetical protein
VSGRIQASARAGRRRIAARGAVLVGLHALLAGLVALQLWGSRLNPPSQRALSACPNVRLDDQDDLVHLSLRPTEAAAIAQLERWDACGDVLRAEARTAVERDRLLILTVAAALGLAIVRTTTGTIYRWRLAGWCSGALAGAYVVADLIENRLMLRLLDGGGWNQWLPYAGSIKFGALAGAVWIFVVSLADATGRCLFIDEDAADIRRKAQAPAPAAEGEGAGEPAVPVPGGRTPLEAARQFRMRRKAHAREAVFGGGESPSPGTQTGISCSGGGIRSAAFNLGALQALDTRRGPDHDAPTELERAAWLSCVSGGSYIAAAWVTARAPTGPEEEPAVAADAWARLSPEEDHLRRHASYMAPGLSGKIWAFWRFLFGFLVNMLAVTLVLGTVFLPAGWLIDRAEEAVPAGTGGMLELPAGGCVRTGDGSVVRVPAGTTLTVFGGRRIRLDPGPPIGAGGAGSSGGRGVDCVAKRLPPDDAWVDLASTPVRAATPVRILVDERLVVRGTRIGAGARLLAAPEVVFTPRAAEANGDADGPVVALVARNGLLAEPCGDHPCEAFRPPAALRWGALAIGATTLLLGISLVIARASSEGTARRTERWARRFSVATLLVLALGFGFPELVVWAENGRWWLESQAIKVGGGFAAAASLLTGLVAQVAPYLRSGEGAPEAPGIARRIAGAIRPLLVKFAGGVVGPAVIVAIAVAFASYAAQQAAGRWQPEQLAIWLAIVGPTAVLLAGGDLNEWSLHPYYRDRLRSAFAVNPRSDRPTDPREDAFWEPGVAQGHPRLLVCAAANVADDRVTAPGRPVASWVFRPDGFGCHALAKIPSIPAADQPSPATIPTAHPFLRRPPLNHLAWTWTAVAVSGAAFSPAMGKMSRPERFLFALGNLRLGVWYPNPRSFAADPGWYERHHPRPWYLAKEALGLHKADDQWIYVTDGGHYENLGLVELLRLGCRRIYCFDASGDSVHTFGTIAEAMRLAREEMGIEITFDPSLLRPDAKGISKLGVWAGTIRFNGEAEPSGWMVVAKLQVPEQAPFDIVDLARSLPSFPTHPTADQLYTDQKFEAYRALGEHLGNQAAALASDIRHLVEAEGMSVARAVAAATGARRPRTVASSQSAGNPPA